MLRKIRIILALLFFFGATLLFLDFTGTVHTWLAWIAKVQLLPALFAVNIGVIIFLVALTILFGRVYCSVICPMGVFQDIFARFGKWHKKNRYSYSPALNGWRYTMLVVMIIAIVLGIGCVVAILAPYSSYGRIAHSLFAPVWYTINNLLAILAERVESYTFYTTDIWLKSTAVFVTALVTFIVVAVLAWRNGRTYCNAICPVGTVLGFMSRFALFRPVIEVGKCNGCGFCSKNCKAACIDSRNHSIDYSRCVSCMDCIGKCRQNAITYSFKKNREIIIENGDEPVNETESAGLSRRNFLGLLSVVGSTILINAKEKTVDGGLAAIEEKKIPKRHTQISPPGSLSHANIESKCTGCQLCISVCPNSVLRPSGRIENFMYPVASYEKGYCRPECTKCSEVCPTGAITKINRAEKSSIQIGRAVWVKQNCVPIVDKVSCGNCARHCPVGAIQMIPIDHEMENSLKIPAVDTERCIGCGACENLCPARPFSAIYVEGSERHRQL